MKGVTKETWTKTEITSILGETQTHYLAYDDRRVQDVEFRLTKVRLETYFRDCEGNLKPWLSPQLLAITRGCMKKCVSYKDNTHPQMFLIEQYTHPQARGQLAVTKHHT